MKVKVLKAPQLFALQVKNAFIENQIVFGWQAFNCRQKTPWQK